MDLLIAHDNEQWDFPEVEDTEIESKLKRCWMGEMNFIATTVTRVKRPSNTYYIKQSGIHMPETQGILLLATITYTSGAIPLRN